MVDPKLWGRSLWTSLFSIAMGYPENPTIDDQSNYQRFFEHLKYVLPCDACRINYDQHIRSNPIHFYLYNRDVLIDWLVTINNQVNKTLQKPILTREETLKKYVYDINKCQQSDYYLFEGFTDGVGGAPSTSRSICKTLLWLIIIGLIIYLLYYYV
jgi:hypothetical protein